MWLIMRIFKELYNYREFLKTSIKKEFRGKYKKSFLGVLWSFLNPLFQLLIYAMVFPFILKNNEKVKGKSNLHQIFFVVN